MLFDVRTESSRVHFLEGQTEARERPGALALPTLTLPACPHRWLWGTR